MDKDKHHYIYYKNIDGNWVYDRTVPRKKYAEKRVKQLKAIHPDATYTVDDIMQGAFY